MIALQTLKYKFLEWCLDTLTDKIINNFITRDIGLIRIKDLYPGMIVSKITATIDWGEGREHWAWLNCKITRFEKYNRDDKDTPYHIDWDYDQCLKNGQSVKYGIEGERELREDEKHIYWYYDPTEPEDLEFHI